MVCSRCVMVVEEIFHSHGIRPAHVTLGEVKLTETLSPQVMELLNSQLMARGFELIDDKKSLLHERTKAAIIDLIHHRDHFELKTNWSRYLSEALHTDYTYLSSLFSAITGITLEQYIIRQKIEKVKEYLCYDELSVKEIAYRLGYSSVAHLSTQFKKVTGLTPSEFKDTRSVVDRKPLDQV